MIPDLPLDIHGVIAEFLAGAFAFGTLANLNVANQGIRDVTTPVLYETLLMDRDIDWELARDAAQARARGFPNSRSSSESHLALPSQSSLKYTR
jgi:hypothetical protein